MKQTKRRRDIKSKLIAAVCMLMVSVIMMVSTSYAWFTLSTAPEVKGIQTAVGANGNLEIALLGTAESFTNPDTISSSVGDSSSATGRSAITANTTWGNLIELSDSSYGLSMISLLPSRLERNVDVTKNNDGTYLRSDILEALMLGVPSYGADGRVNKVSADNTMVAPFDSSTNTFGTKAGATTQYGVRAVGTSSNRSLREITYDTSLAQAGVYASQFRTDAIASLNANGNGLASLGTKQANGTTTFTQAEVRPLYAIIDSILGTRIFKEDADGKMVFDKRADDGLANTALQAALYYGIAAFASGLNTASYENDAAFTEAMNNTEAVKEFAKGFDEILALYTQITVFEAAAYDAAEALPNEGEYENTSYTWDEISTAVSTLFNNMDVWGYQIRDLINKVNDPNGMTEIMDLYAENGNKIIANIKGGVYNMMADLTGEFSVSTGLYLNETYQNMPTTMVAKRSSNTPVLMSTAAARVTASPAPRGTGDSPKISDAYGYVIDMAFRTNASESNLLLQTAGTQRISSSTNESTQGAGSTMTFRAADANFTVEQMANLMNHINVVFFAPNALGVNYDVLCVAKLDMGTDVVEGNVVDSNKYQIITKDNDGNVTKVENPHYTVNTTSKTITANLYVVGYAYTEENGVITTTESLITDQNNAVICPLDANTAKQVSVLVHLDGESVTNKDVAVGNSSMSGTLNLQFSSSANLVPMSYNGSFAPANPVTQATEAPAATETTAATEATTESTG